ncbi:hypothetical protein AYL99_07917 [Fonsecaea erecta]|uniref:Uncharacterized protein n=1 Tax=Fonsecaea erecta TaxID=1367422 RepID=A0A178ZBN3_9EURO|nr:hypothetical protein AYL99_07917 [Fonsecaea erecta]OAP57179.1 hypothetical protein AYL99_07917 [Fonsecaea erecta]
MEDTSPDTPFKYVVPQLRQHPTRSDGLPTEPPPRFNLPGFAHAASRQLGTGTTLTSILESPSPPSLDPDTAHFAEEETPLAGSPVQASTGGHLPSSSTNPANPQHPVAVFKKFLPKSLREVDPDLYLVAFQEQLALQIKEMTVAAKRTNLPRHLVSPLAHLRALAHTVDQIKQPRRYTTKVTRAKKCAQIQKLLDALQKVSKTALKDDSDSAHQDKVLGQDDGLDDLITSYDCDLQRQLDALKPCMVDYRVALGISMVMVVVSVLILLIYSRSSYSWKVPAPWCVSCQSSWC